MDFALYAQWLLITLLVAQLLVAVYTAYALWPINTLAFMALAVLSIYLSFMILKATHGYYNLLTFNIRGGG